MKCRGCWNVRTDPNVLCRGCWNVRTDLNVLWKVAKAGKQRTPVDSSSDSSGTIRFSAKGLAAQRKRLDLSVVAVAKILGVSSQSVTNWESGKTRPRASQLAAIAALRKMGKKEAVARLAA